MPGIITGGRTPANKQIGSLCEGTTDGPEKQNILHTNGLDLCPKDDGGHKQAEDPGWLGTPNSDLIESALYDLVKTITAETYIQKVKARVRMNHVSDIYMASQWLPKVPPLIPATGAHAQPQEQ